MMTKLKHKWSILTIAFVVLLLTACGTRIDQTATFYDDQSWNAEIVITIPQQLIALAGTTTGFDQEIAEELRDMESAGVDISYESRSEEGAVKYFIKAQGNDLSSLQRIAFEGAAINMRTVNGQQQIEFAMNMPSGLVGSSITLIGEEIVSSNGRVVEKGKVEWFNPTGRIEAVIVPKSRFGLSTLLGPLGIGAGVLLVAGMGFYLARRRRPQKQGAVRFCSRCGSVLASSARFCNKCGRPAYPR